MGNRKAKVLDISGTFSDTPDFPVAVVREPAEDENTDKIVDPVLDFHVTRNLFGRMMTLVEATSEQHKLKAVKNLFAKELSAWENDVYESARELADGGNSSANLYTKDSIR